MYQTHKTHDICIIWKDRQFFFPLFFNDFNGWRSCHFHFIFPFPPFLRVFIQIRLWFRFTKNSMAFVKLQHLWSSYTYCIGFYFCLALMPTLLFHIWSYSICHWWPSFSSKKKKSFFSLFCANHHSKCFFTRTSEKQRAKLVKIHLYTYIFAFYKKDEKCEKLRVVRSCV